jgi:hypothetical protein
MRISGSKGLTRFFPRRKVSSSTLRSTPVHSATLAKVAFTSSQSSRTSPRANEGSDTARGTPFLSTIRPGRIDEHLAQLVVPGHLGKGHALVHLQIPQAQGEQTKDAKDQGLEQDQARTGGLLLRGFTVKPHGRFPAGADG